MLHEITEKRGLKKQVPLLVRCYLEPDVARGVGIDLKVAILSAGDVITVDLEILEENIRYPVIPIPAFDRVGPFCR